MRRWRKLGRFSPAPVPYEYYACVTDVHDGDSITVDLSIGFGYWHHKFHVRLNRIDAPELKVTGPDGHKIDNPAGYMARNYLRHSLPLGLKVIVNSIVENPTDAYPDRWDCEVVFLDGTNLSDMIVAAGQAVYRKF